MKPPRPKVRGFPSVQRGRRNPAPKADENPFIPALKHGAFWCVGKGKPGPKSQLTEAKKEKVRQVLLKGPQALGYATNIWTLKRITEVIKKVAKVKFHPGYVWYILQSMGWSCQKPRVQSKYRDERIIAHWKRVVWPAIKKRGKN